MRRPRRRSAFLRRIVKHPEVRSKHLCVRDGREECEATRNDQRCRERKRTQPPHDDLVIGHACTITASQCPVSRRSTTATPLGGRRRIERRTVYSRDRPRVAPWLPEAPRTHPPLQDHTPSQQETGSVPTNTPQKVRCGWCVWGLVSVSVGGGCTSRGCYI